MKIKFKRCVRYNDGSEIWLSPIYKDNKNKDFIIAKANFNNKSIYVKLPDKIILNENLSKNEMYRRISAQSEVFMEIASDYKNTGLLYNLEIEENIDRSKLL